VLDAARQRARVGEPEAARELGRCQSARQLDERERVAARLVEDPAAHSRVHRARHGGLQQRAGVGVREAFDHQLRQSLEHVPVAGLAQREYQSHPFRQEPPRHERERLRGYPVEPVRVVDDAHQRRLLGDLGQQAQDRQPDQEAIRGAAILQAEHHAQRVPLRAGQTVEFSEHGRAQRMQAGEWKLHLGLDACRPGDPASLRGCRQVPQECGLADARLAAQDQHAALARAHSRDESFQHVALGDAVEQARRWQVGVEHARPPLLRAPSTGNAWGGLKRGGPGWVMRSRAGARASR
jgi:hypothetical protein